MEKINHPKHYHPDTIEAIKVIEAWDLNFSLGNAIKYIARAGHKENSNKIEDLRKARWYVQREIDSTHRIKINGIDQKSQTPHQDLLGLVLDSRPIPNQTNIPQEPPA